MTEIDPMERLSEEQVMVLEKEAMGLAVKITDMFQAAEIANNAATWIAMGAMIANALSVRTMENDELSAEEKRRYVGEFIVYLSNLMMDYSLSKMGLKDHDEDEDQPQLALH